MSWGAQNRSEDAKTPSGSRGRSDKPELDLWPVHPYHFLVLNISKARMNNNQRNKQQAQQQQRSSLRQQWHAGAAAAAPSGQAPCVIVLP
jgi:hypothetical protein